jgi:hypothetical protein
MKKLEGVQVLIQTKHLKKIIGIEVSYLLKRDIDKTGRGYFFPQAGTITEVFNKHVVFDDNGDYVHFSAISEITTEREQG